MHSLAFPVGATRLTPVNLTRNYPGDAVTVRTAGGLYRGIVSVLFFGVLTSSGVVFGQDLLTLTEAQHRAVERSRQLSAQDSAALASREMAVSAGQLPDPVLRFGIDNLPINGPDQFSIGNDFMTQRRIGVMQEFTRSEKRQLRAERFEREAEKYLAEKTAIVASIQRDTALAWLDRYYAEAMAAAIADQMEQVKREILAAESAYRAGRGSQADVFAAHGVLVGLEDRASELNRRIATAKTGLARWIGDGAKAPLGEKPAIDSIRMDTSSLDSDLRHHPQIAILSKQIEVAAAETRIAQANKKADWTVELSYSQRGSAYSNMVSLGVSVPLQWDQKQRQERDIASKMATTEQAKAQLEDMLRAHVAEVRSMIQEWENGRERLARYQRELIPITKERSRATLTAYQGGKAGLNDVLLARRNETEVRLQALQLEADTARLWAQLNFLFPETAGSTQGHASPAGSFPKEAQ
jgi:outer membrane protein TolC